MGKIKSIEYFRVLPRWLFVKVTDEDGNHGWGESTLEGHSEAVEGALNALCQRFQGYEADVERLKAVKDLGLDAALDFHGRLHKPMAKQLAKLVEPYQPLFIEEPLLSEHPEGIKHFSNQVTTPIALGERLYNRWDVKRFLENASVDVLQPDISHCGGISEIRRIAAMAEAYDVAIAPHCPLGPISLAASIQVDLTIPNFVIQEMSLGIHYNTEAGPYDITNYVTDPSVFDVKDGYVDALTKPGLGIDIDEDEVRSVAMTADSWAPKEFYGVDGGLPSLSNFHQPKGMQALFSYIHVLLTTSGLITWSLESNTDQPTTNRTANRARAGSALFDNKLEVMVTFWVAFQITAIIFIVVAAAIGQAALDRNYEDGPLYCYNELSIDDTKPEPILSIIRDCCKKSDGKTWVISYVELRADKFGNCKIGDLDMRVHFGFFKQAVTVNTAALPELKI
ncbi:mandelate racemase/muconate lactonizing enzyme family protein [Histoplasma capsulatum H143]|uniref:Mandelate racemase/muconate lactonizing enzyme family protein n=1 Tax=Ajellomyces capsulatus (strain H143) TaxID=544712 RepID=C6H1U4_AJECH|nr:mandelate racemase/muconate lactonizing enzyme family protein [Histoplasma capsulatum H143]